MKERMKSFYMGFAENCAHMSRARRLQVGAVIVKDDNIISFSWNGTPAGWDNNCEDVEWCSSAGWLSPEEIKEQYPYEGWHFGAQCNVPYRLKTKPEVLHAERNALDKLARQGGRGGEGSVMFITHAPCIECAKSIYGAGVKQVYFRDHYRSADGIEFLEKCGIPVEQISLDV